MTTPRDLYWDSCVFIRYLTGAPAEYSADIAQFISEEKSGKYKIHFSTIAFAEIRPRSISSTKYRSATELFNDLGSAFYPFDPNPNIMADAGVIRDCDPTNPSDPKIGEENKRCIGTADAIHLSTCLYLKEVIGLVDIEFHTFDKGKGKTWEGKCVPLIWFERWYPPERRTGRIDSVCQLKRTIPKHSAPDLTTKAQNSAAVISQQRH